MSEVFEGMILVGLEVHRDSNRLCFEGGNANWTAICTQSITLDAHDNVFNDSDIASFIVGIQPMFGGVLQSIDLVDEETRAVMTFNDGSKIIVGDDEMPIDSLILFEEKVGGRWFIIG